MTDDQSSSGGKEGRSDGPLVGEDVPRREDAALLSGRAEYTDDLQVPGMTHLAFVRAEPAHARIESVDMSAAEAIEGVFGVYTWADIEATDIPGVIPIASSRLDADPPGHPVLAREKVTYQGQPVAAVVAEDRYRAQDAIDAVEVAYEPLEAVVDPTEAREEDAPTLFEEAPDNVAVTAEMGDQEATDEAFADADHVVEIDLVNNRLIPSALEPRAALARWDGDGKLTVEMTSQSPHGHRGKLAQTLGLPERRIRVIAPAVGGGFGHKGHHHPGEAAAAWASRQLDRPVKWTATRSGNYLAGAHGRDHRTHAEIALDDDGTIQAIRVDTDANAGGYGLGGGPSMPGWYGRLLSSQYDIPAIYSETRAVFTNTAPIHSYRGAGRPEAVYVTERLVDAAAHELGIDPIELRRRNLIDPDQFPYETAVGAEYDSGEYEKAMDKALNAVDYEEIREELRDQSGADGRYRGVGVANYVESTGGGYESGVVRVHPDGGVTAYAGTHSHGQGHETTYAQIVADELELPYEEITVVEGDTEQIPKGTGTFGSRSAIVGGNAVAESAGKVLDKATKIAAHELAAEPDEAEPEAVEYEDGTFSNPESGETTSFEEVASTAYGWGVPEGLEPGLEATTFYEPDGTAYTFGTHVAVVAVDPETGEVEIKRYLAVDDCGEQINPELVEGQVHGGVAQGIGQARYELTAYDESGDLLTDELLTYAAPRAFQLPDFETDSTVTPSPNNPMGVKGIGEGGTIAAPPTLVNAVVDALADLGIKHVDMPLTEERVWTAIRRVDCNCLPE